MAFYEAININEVEISKKVKRIEDYAFFGCQNLNLITMYGKVEYIGESAFEKCLNLRDFNISFYRSLDINKNAFENIVNKVNINVYYDISYIMTITGQTTYKNKFINIFKNSKYWIWRFIAKEV